MLPSLNGLLVLVVSGLLGSSASPIPSVNGSSDGNVLPIEYLKTDDISLNPHAVFRRSLGNGVPLRILSLGASITEGYGSDDTGLNGYRYFLRSALVAGGNPVNMVGSRKLGSMADNENQGVSGTFIDQVHDAVRKDVVYKPNLVLILCGTNDATLPVDPANMHVRMDNMLNTIFTALPKTTVIVAKLSMLANAAADANVVNFNKNLEGVIANHQSQGRRASWVDMHSSWWTLADFRDGMHPTADGYAKMASVWYDGIKAVANEIQKAEPVDGIPDSGPNDDPSNFVYKTCAADFKNFNGPIKTQSGVGPIDDGNYRHSAVRRAVNIPLTPSNLGGYPGIRWADINGDGLDDYVYIWKDMTTMSVCYNEGNGKFSAPTHFPFKDFGYYCATRMGVQFGDFGADGKSDLVCVTPEGSVYLYTNVYDGSIGTPLFRKEKTIMFGAKTGGSVERIRLADIDGDGRCDVVLIRSGYVMFWWRNAGREDMPTNFQDAEVISSRAFPSLAGIRFVDINGDGKFDLLYVDDLGGVSTLINRRGMAAGNLVPVWMDAGKTHGGVAAGDVQIASAQAQISFGRIFAFGSDPAKYVNADYVFAGSKTAEGWPTDFRVHENQGIGGRRQKGDGVRYCDMRGTGRDDYLFIGPGGDVSLWGNTGTPGAWKMYNNPILQTGQWRKKLHLADLDGNGRCDVIHVERTTGAISVWKNMGEDANGKFTFKFFDAGAVSKGLSCKEAFGGVLEEDLGVRFADMDGDGKADYLCIEKDGNVNGFWNKGWQNTWQSAGRFKKPEGADRANVRFADLTGSGRADYMWLDRRSGSVKAFRNTGTSLAAAGSAVGWQPPTMVTKGGIARGACIHFPSFNKGKRADYHVVNPQTNSANTYFNVCPGSGTDSETVVESKPLPVDPTNDSGDINFPRRELGKLPDLPKPDDPSGIPWGTVDCSLIGDRDVLDGKDLWEKAHGTQVLEWIMENIGKSNIDQTVGQLLNWTMFECTGFDCKFPATANCEDFAPHQKVYYLIAYAFSKLSRYYVDVRDAVSTACQVLALSPKDIINDFQPFIPKTGNGGSFDTLSAILGMASAALGVSNPTGGAVFAVGGSLLSLLDLGDDKDAPKFEDAAAEHMEKRLKWILQNTGEKFNNMSVNVFSRGELPVLPYLTLPDGAHPPKYGLSQLFAGGRFAGTYTPEIAVQLKTEVQKSTEASIINTVLVAANMFVLRNRYTLEECVSQGGIRMSVEGDVAGDNCYTLQTTPTTLDRVKEQYTTNVGKREAFLSTLEKYGIKLHQIMASSWHCQITTEKYMGSHAGEPRMFSYQIKDEGKTPDYSSCAFNLPVLIVWPHENISPKTKDFRDYLTSPCVLSPVWKSLTRITDAPNAKAIGNYLPDHLHPWYAVEDPPSCSVAEEITFDPWYMYNKDTVEWNF